MPAVWFPQDPHHPVSPPVLQVVLPAPDGGEEGSVLVRHVLVASSLGYEGLAGPPVITRHSSRSDRHPHWDPLTPAETDRLRVSSELRPHSSLLTTTGTNE